MSIRRVFEMLTGGDERLDLFDQFAKFAQTTNMDYESVLESVYFENDHLPPNEQLQLLLSECQRALSYILERTGIVLAEDSVLQDYINVNNAVMSCVNYEDRGTMHDLMSTDECNEDKIRSVLALVTVLDETYFSTVVQAVSQSTVDALVAMCKNTDQQLDAQQLATISAKVDEYRYYKVKLQNVSLLPDNLLQSPGSINLPMQEYMSAFAQRVDFYEQNTDVFVKDYYGFSLLSKEGASDFLNGLDKACAQLYFKPDTQTKVSMFARTFLGTVA